MYCEALLEPIPPDMKAYLRAWKFVRELTEL